MFRSISKTDDHHDNVKLMLVLCYFSIVVSLMSISPCLLYIDQDPAFQMTGFLPTILLLSTFAIASGKVILGPLTDILGGNFVLEMSMILNCICLTAASFTQDIYLFGILWIFENFIFSSTWGAISKVVHDVFIEKEWSDLISMIAAGSRLGSLLSSLVFGVLLSFGCSWRMIFRVAVFQQFVIVLYYIRINGRLKLDSLHVHKEEHSPKQLLHDDSNSKHETVVAIFSRISKDYRFWLMLLSKISLMIVGSFINFLPLFLQTGHFKFNIEAFDGAVVSSAFSIGSLVSNLIASKEYPNMTPHMQFTVVSLSNMSATSVTTILAINALYNINVSVFFLFSLLFIWGAAWAIVYYIPSGILALELGGWQHSALITNVFDIGGYLAGAIFSFYAMDFGSRGKWYGLLVFLCLCNVCSLLSMSISMHYTLWKAAGNIKEFDSRL